MEWVCCVKRVYKCGMGVLVCEDVYKCGVGVLVCEDVYKCGVGVLCEEGLQVWSGCVV